MIAQAQAAATQAQEAVRALQQQVREYTERILTLQAAPLRVEHTVTQLIEAFRKYDGSTPAEKWITQFESDLDQHHLDSAWALRHLDRILQGNARAWWQSQELNAAANFAPDVALETWRRVREALIIFFGDEAAKENARHKNKTLKFKIGDDPQNFVTRKIELIRTIHPQISEPKIVEKLLKDLPEEFVMNMTMACGLNATVQGFLYHLRRLVEVGDRQRKKEIPKLFRDTRDRPHEFRTQSRPREPPASNSSGRLSIDQLRSLVDDQGRRLCSMCYQSGHLKRDCPTLHQPPPGFHPRNSRPYNGPQNYNNTPHNYNTSPQNFNNYTRPPQGPSNTIQQNVSYPRPQYSNQHYAHAPPPATNQQPPRHDMRDRELNAIRAENEQLRAQLRIQCSQVHHSEN